MIRFTRARWSLIFLLGLVAACSDDPAGSAGSGAGGRVSGGAAGGPSAAGSGANVTGGSSAAGNSGSANQAGRGGLDGSGDAGAAESGEGGVAGNAGSFGAAGNGGVGIGLGGSAGTAGVAGAAGAAGSAGASPTSELARWIESGSVSTELSSRPDFGGLVVANDQERSYVVESRREIVTGPFGLPWRTRFRLAAYDRGTLAWAFVVDPDDLIGDVVVHPSGDLTLAWEQFTPERAAYRLVRLGHDGTPKAVIDLPAPATIPESDHAANEARPLLRMKSDFGDATTAGWLRLAADGENLALAALSYVDAQIDGAWSNRLAIAIETLDWNSNAYTERWARLVDGTHVANPAAWAYDELRWREQAVRPYLAYDAAAREWLVGRAWNTSRCAANRGVFVEFTAAECTLGAVNPVENERLPLAVTRFSSTGERIGTSILQPDSDAAEQVPFALVANDGLWYVVGSVVRSHPDGSKHTYPDASGFVDYDGYLAVYSTDGTRLAVKDVNLGRGDVLAALRWTQSGIIAVGSSGWDRWQGGMSISRGSDPLLAWFASDASRAVTRVLSLSDGTRHFGLHDVAIFNDAIVAFGFADAPMTHSADSDPSARTFGGLQVTLSATASP